MHCAQDSLRARPQSKFEFMVVFCIQMGFEHSSFQKVWLSLYDFIYIPIRSVLAVPGMYSNTILPSAPLTPKLWLRYVDDTFVLWPHGQKRLEEFHDHLNKHHHKIQFTREEESNNHISFLDVSVTKKDGTFETTVYRKLTHTDRYTHFSSHHHPRVVKSGTIKCPVKRVEMICDNNNRKKNDPHQKHLQEERLSGTYHLEKSQDTSQTGLTI